jgi:hypothetical protein
VPELASSADTQFFDLDDFDATTVSALVESHQGGSSSQTSLQFNLPFLGYYFAANEFVIVVQSATG